ncbi:MAG: chemotaxis protein CheB, partial [Micavibrio aeruginosavorus]
MNDDIQNDTLQKAIVIGASAGALQALSTILPFLPENYPFPVMIVVHLPSEKKSLIAELMQLRCKIKVIEAEDKIPLRAGTVYFVPADYHMLVEKSGHLSLSAEEPVFFSRPSIDLLFETAADAFGKNLVAIVLTGANSDGAKGSKQIQDMGGAVIVQNPVHARAKAMPEATPKTFERAQK